MFSVYYRTGGIVNFQWHLVMQAFANREDAAKAAADLSRMGYPAHYADSKLLESIGLPETFA